MRIATFAEVLTADHPYAKQGARGLLLKDVLDSSDGRYEVEHVFADGVKEHYRGLAKAAATRNREEVSRLAEQSSVVISLEHLRGYDPETTYIVYGVRIVPEQGDGNFDGNPR